MILVPIDFSEDSFNALDHALAIASILKAGIQIIHVKGAKKFALPKNLLDQLEVSTKGSLDKVMKKVVDKYQKKTEFPIEVKVREGKVHKEISNHAKYNDSFMIVMGTHGASGFEEFFMGSNSFKVVAEAGCPVITVRHGFARRELKNIVMPITKISETKHKIKFVAELSKLTGSKVHVLGVNDGDDKDEIRSMEANLAFTKKFYDEHKVDYLQKTLIGSNLTTLAVDYASQVAAELIAISAEQPASVKNFWMGSYSQQLVNHSPIPVVTVPQSS